MPEQWAVIPGFSGRYEISNHGRVRSTRVFKATRVVTILRPSNDRRGYQKVTLCDKGKKRSYKIHCLVATAFPGERPSGFTINHKDGCKSNNRDNNVENEVTIPYLQHKSSEKYGQLIVVSATQNWPRSME